MRTLALLLLTAGVAHADPIKLRMASVVPEGTAWARELKALAREIDTDTGGQVKMKWYLGGITGDDFESGRRIARGQLDGWAGGAWQCEKGAKSMVVTRLPGLYRSRAEIAWIEGRLRPTFDEEFKKAGFVFLGDSVIGPSIIFLRKAVHRFGELKRIKLWSLAD